MEGCVYTGVPSRNEISVQGLYVCKHMVLIYHVHIIIEAGHGEQRVEVMVAIMTHVILNLHLSMPATSICHSNIVSHSTYIICLVLSSMPSRSWVGTGVYFKYFLL